MRGTAQTPWLHAVWIASFLVNIVQATTPDILLSVSNYILGRADESKVYWHGGKLQM